MRLLIVGGNIVLMLDRVSVAGSAGIGFWVGDPGALWVVAVLGGEWTGCDISGREIIPWSVGGAKIPFSWVRGVWGRVITVASPAGGRPSCRTVIWGVPGVDNQRCIKLCLCQWRIV